MTEWQEANLSDVAFFQEGPGILAKDFVKKGTPLVRLAGLGGYRVTLKGCNFVSTQLASTKWSQFKLTRGDILVSTSASFGRPAEVDGETEGALFYTGLVRFRSKSNLLLDGYLKLFLGSSAFMDQALALATGSVIQHFGPTHLRQMFINLPDVQTQNNISSFAEILDDKIAANRAMNDTLEKMARAIFTDWFVDFGPTRAKMAGDAPYLAPEIWDLFPDTIDPTTTLPTGWEMKPLGSVFDLVMGQSPPGHTYNDDGEGLPFFQGRTDFSERFPVNRKYCSAPTRTAKADDTLISVRAPVGDINRAIEKCCIGRGVAALRHKSGAAEFTYYSAWHLQQHIQQFEHTGTVFGSISKTQFEALLTIDPDDKTTQAFSNLVSPMDHAFENNIQEIKTLAKMRDLLLSPLMSGKLRVATADDHPAPKPTQKPDDPPKSDDPPAPTQQPEDEDGA